MSFSAAGLATLALLILVLGVLIPQQLRYRQALVDSRVDDRFSGQLRVVINGRAAGPRAVAARIRQLATGNFSGRTRREREIGMGAERAVARTSSVALKAVTPASARLEIAAPTSVSDAARAGDAAPSLGAARAGDAARPVGASIGCPTPMQPGGADIVRPGADTPKPSAATVRPGAAVRPVGVGIGRSTAMQPGGAATVRPGADTPKPGAATPSPGAAIVRPVGAATVRPSALRPDAAAVTVRTGAVERIPDRAVSGQLRAQRARRRLILCATLLALTLGAWVIVAITALAWWVGLVPSLLLGLVLVAGALAARAARQADQVRRRRREATRSGWASGPMPVVAAPATVLRASGVPTVVIPRAGVSDGDRAARPLSKSNAVAPRFQPVSAGVANVAPTSASVVAIAVAAAVANEPAAPKAVVERVPSGVVAQANRAWAPREVPTYLTALTGARPAAASARPETATPAVAGASGAGASDAATSDAATPETSWHLGATPVKATLRLVESVAIEDVDESLGAPVGSGWDEGESEISTDSLGLPLTEILARRRVS